MTSTRLYFDVNNKMNQCMLVSDESDDETNINSSYLQTTISDELRTFTPKELNDELLQKTSDIAQGYKCIFVVGEITAVPDSPWKGGNGVGFKVTANKKSLECNVWFNKGCSFEKIRAHANKKCQIFGSITAKYWYSHKFVIDVQDITLITSDTKIKRLKKDCVEKGYFVNKKSLPERHNIKHLGIISKRGTQGYNDFMKQFHIPIEITVKEITLEGTKTEKQCISAIQELQHVDVIIIMRGGGATSEISQSYDTLELFRVMHQSRIPIITAIGHEADKGDKLLITEVSDVNYSTPTTAATEFAKVFTHPIQNEVQQILRTIASLFVEKWNAQYECVYQQITKWFDTYKEGKLGGQIISIPQNSKCVIVRRGNSLYKVMLTYDDEVECTPEDIQLMDDLTEGISNHQFEHLKSVFEENTSFQDLISKIVRLKKLKVSFDNAKAKNMKSLYCKPFDLSTCSLRKYQQLYSMFLWYNENEFSQEIYQYLSKWFDCHKSK